MKTQYRYLRGSTKCGEMIAFDLHREGCAVTTCEINVQLLLAGVKAFPCKNADDYAPCALELLDILEFLQAERQKVRDCYPVKTRVGWRESGLSSLEDFCVPGDEVDFDLVDELMNSVPPVTLRRSCAQCGEAFSFAEDESGRCRNTYATFHNIGGGRWMFDGYCFRGENVNRNTNKTSLERRIEEVKEELKCDC